MQACTQSTQSDVWSQLATTPECVFQLGDRQSEKKQQNGDLRVICDPTRGLDAGRGVIRHWGISDGSDRERPVWRSHSTRTEMFFADESHFKPGPVMSKCLSWDSMVPTTWCYAVSMAMASFRGPWISPLRTHVRFNRERWIVFFGTTNCEIQQWGMLIARKIDQVSLVICTNPWHNHWCSRELILHVPSAISHIHLTVHLMPHGISKVHRFTMVMRLNCKASWEALDTFGNIPVVQCD